MPPRDEAEWERRRQQIMEGALKVFSRHGYEKATNKQIAEAAGIGSPGLIYHYFKDKRDLFQQILEHHSVTLQLLSNPDALMALPPRDVLTRLATHFLEMFTMPQVVALFRLVLGEVLRRPTVAEMMNQIGPSRFFHFLNNYLSQQMALGTMRQMDPTLATRAFVGPLVAYIFTTQVFVQEDAGRHTTEEVVTNFVDLFLRGMAPD